MAGERNNFSDLQVLLGVSGGIAAYKVVEVASGLSAGGATVRTVMTDSSLRLVGAKSFEAVTGSAVFTSLWEARNGYEIGHVDLVEGADLVVVAPATADIIGKAANGICDDLLSTVLCACWKKRVLLAPAMNSDMWANPAVQRNVKAVESMGFERIGPEEGRLASGAIGVGRMSEPAAILAAVGRIAAQIKNQSG